MQHGLLPLACKAALSHPSMRPSVARISCSKADVISTSKVPDTVAGRVAIAFVTHSIHQCLHPILLPDRQLAQTSADDLTSTVADVTFPTPQAQDDAAGQPDGDEAADDDRAQAHAVLLPVRQALRVSESHRTRLVQYGVPGARPPQRGALCDQEEQARVQGARRQVRTKKFGPVSL